MKTKHDNESICVMCKEKIVVLSTRVCESSLHFDLCEKCFDNQVTEFLSTCGLDMKGRKGNFVIEFMKCKKVKCKHDFKLRSVYYDSGYAVDGTCKLCKKNVWQLTMDGELHISDEKLWEMYRIQEGIHTQLELKV